MEYVKFPLSKFFEQIDTESKAIALAWQYKDAGQGHRCGRCKRAKHYQHKISVLKSESAFIVGIKPA